MLFRFLIFAFSLIFSIEAQIFQALKSLTPGGAPNFFPSTDKTTAYVSAFFDDSSLLKQINFTTTGSDDFETADSLQQLTYGSVDNRIGWILKGDLIITTTLSQDQLNTLTGSFYISTVAQAASRQFFVYDAINQTTIDASQLQMNTAVILNSDFRTSPAQATKISNWQQNPNAVVRIYRGLPSDDAQPESAAIFSNPVNIPGVSYPVFIKNVEPFSILGPFYMTISGDFVFSIDNGYVDQSSSTTSNPTTTGLFSQGPNQNSVRNKVLISGNSTDGATGANTIVYQISAGGVVDIDFTLLDRITYVYPTNATSSRQQWIEYERGYSLEVAAPLSPTAEYYTQFYVFDGPIPAAPTSGPAVSTSTSSPTSSASSSAPNTGSTAVPASTTSGALTPSATGTSTIVTDNTSPAAAVSTTTASTAAPPNSPASTLSTSAPVASSSPSTAASAAPPSSNSTGPSSTQAPGSQSSTIQTTTQSSFTPLISMSCLVIAIRFLLASM